MTTATEPILTDAMRREIEAYLPRYPTKRAVVLPALHIVQEHLRCVPNQAIVEIAEVLDLAPAEVHDTMSFYGFFRPAEDPLGRHRVWVCRSISCAIRGGEQVLDHVCAKLGVKPGGTTSDGRITVEFAECLGGCDFAPCLLVDGVLHKNLTDATTDELLKSLD
jgi:NADH-quinone oxidoreductase subunit E